MPMSFMAKPQQPQQGQDVPPMMKALLKMPGVGQGVSQIFAIIQAVDMQLKQQNEMLKVLLTVAAEQRDAIEHMRIAMVAMTETQEATIRNQQTLAASLDAAVGAENSQ